ncbi:MAG: protein translocase subunit SecDF [Prevotellaceae bacterium]|jgi:SecD/SecF fusion protein|nr:protein translocase subunit SecDF [Prevotellaceae bacterium]
MQAKGFIKFVALLCFLASVWMLSFTFVTGNIEKNAKIEATDASGVVDEVKEAEILRNKRNEKVWLGYTYKECKDKELSLGLDLKGGMNVMMEISIPEVIKSLANQSIDATFVKAVETAQEKEKSSTSDFLTLFEQSWNEIEPGGRMSRIFAVYGSDRIKAESTNSEVMSILRLKAEEAVAGSFKVLRKRIDRFGVTAPNIQRLGSSNRIFIELPGVKETERVRKLLQGTASLEFWETYENSEIIRYLEQANAEIKAIIDEEKKASGSETVKDSIIAENIVDTALTVATDVTPTDDSAALTALSDSLQISSDSVIMANNPLFAILSPMFSQEGRVMKGPVIGYVSSDNIEKVDKWLSHPRVKNLFPVDFRPMWGIKAVDKGETTYQLFAIKSTADGIPQLDGEQISEAMVTNDPREGYGVSMNMKNEGVDIWARLTAQNIDRCIAIVLDGYVYSAPVVRGEIKGGNSQITGGFTSTEATDLSNVLSCGKMSAPAKIIQEAIVGPSLGQESINAGFLSFILAFILVLVYMWIYYSTAGMTANIALLSNVLLLFGVLTSFGAVLTLPGIAGIVLTMGMAVDANVIIYERIKEELRLGKSLKMAVSEGYKHAMSAILDGQITTFLMAIVLFATSSGPVQGFATTLGIGIITSLVTSIFISRLVVEWMLAREMGLKFGNKFTFRVLEHSSFNFLRLRKKAYVLSIIICLVGVVFMFTKKFSLGVDFAGGRAYVVRFDNEISVEEVRQNIAEMFDASAEVKQYGPANQLRITTKYKIEDKSDEVDREVTEKLYSAVNKSFKNELSYGDFISTQENPYGIISSEKVEATIAYDMQVNSVIAILLTLLIIFLYIAFRFNSWSWGTGAVIAMAHDALLTIALFSVCAGLVPWSMDIDQHFIAAVLTVIGYSINDTVIIFDRIRENKTLYPKRDWQELINDAINSTLMRTINTSGTVLVVLIAIFIFGGETIRGFSFSLTFGILVGVYSTVFIAIPLSYELIMKQEKKKRQQEKDKDKKTEKSLYKK